MGLQLRLGAFLRRVIRFMLALTSAASRSLCLEAEYFAIFCENRGQIMKKLGSFVYYCVNG
jgi:hypothetical protein